MPLRMRGRRRARALLAAVVAATFGGAVSLIAVAQPQSPDAGMAEPPAEEPPPEEPLPSEPPPPEAPQPLVTPMPAPRQWEARTTAELQALNKIDDRSARLNVPVGQTAQFERLSITVRACVVRSTDQGQDTAAFLQIVDAHPGAPGFTGWMLAAAPFLSMLEHPGYDVRILACR